MKNNLDADLRLAIEKFTEIRDRKSQAFYYADTDLERGFASGGQSAYNNVIAVLNGLLKG